jgi:hypothetical protein
MDHAVTHQQTGSSTSSADPGDHVRVGTSWDKTFSKHHENRSESWARPIRHAEPLARRQHVEHVTGRVPTARWHKLTRQSTHAMITEATPEGCYERTYQGLRVTLRGFTNHKRHSEECGVSAGLRSADCCEHKNTLRSKIDRWAAVHR